MSLHHVPETYIPFPADFLWGAASAAYQVHGSPQNSNWVRWTLSDKRQRELKSQGVPEERLHEFVCGNACEFETRFRDDMKMLKQFGHNTIRFSIDWASVEPEPGVFNYGALDNYREMCNFARAIGLEPVITLYHWTHREGFEWYQEDAAIRFARFVRTTIPYLGPIKYFTVLNEPNVYAHFSYRWGEWPPQIRDEAIFETVMKNLAEAHRLAHGVIKLHLPTAKVGIGQAFGWHTSDDPKLKAEKDRWQYDFLDEIKDYLDFIGVQLYMHSHFSRDESKNSFGWEGKDACADHPVTSDMIGAKSESWGMCPEAIYRVVVEAWDRYGLPIMVTEHGHAVPELDDNRRCWYLWESIGWLECAIMEGIPLIGYLHWSMMDNFEWKFGWGPKFGLFHVDRATQKRTPRQSAFLYRRILEENGRTDGVKYGYADLVQHPHKQKAA